MSMFEAAKNHFELFGLPVAFGVDSQALTAHYRDLQRVIHPDRYAAAGDQERRLSLQRATLVNEAFAILNDPLKRATYLLGLLDFELASQAVTLDDEEFLTEQLELRDQLADIRHQADPLAALGELVRQLAHMRAILLARITVCFEEATTEALQEVQQSIAKLQFLDKLRVETEALEVDLEDLA